MCLVTMLACVSVLNSQVHSNFPSTRSLSIPIHGVAEPAVREIVGAVTRSAPVAFVSEDGSTVAVWSGTLTKVDAKRGKVLAHDDKYRLGIRGSRKVAFDVSQERGVRESYRGWTDVPLKPVALLDSHRTLCVDGPLSAPSAMNPQVSKRVLYLAAIDDRQRGATPNRVRELKFDEEVSATSISPVGVRAGNLILRVVGRSRTRFLSVNPNNLAAKWIPWNGWKGVAADVKAIRRRTLSFNPLVTTRWAGRSYFLAPGTPPATYEGFLWNGAALKSSGQQYLAASSLNGRYAWLVDRESGESWLLTR